MINNKIIRRLLFFLFLIVLATVAQAVDSGLYFKLPKVGPNPDQNFVEVGAKATIDIYYKKTPEFASAAKTSGGTLFFIFDDQKIDQINFTLNPLAAAALKFDKNGVSTIPGKQNRYEISLDQKNLSGYFALNGDDTYIGTISFHVVQNDDKQGPLIFNWESGSMFVALALWDQATGSLGNDSITTPPPVLSVEQSYSPNFDGILQEGAQALNTGNTVTLDWDVNGQSATDKKQIANARTEWGVGNQKLRYRVYRSDGADGNYEPLDGETEETLTKEDLINAFTKQDGNDSGQYTVAKPLYDGTKYWYKVVGLDYQHSDNNTWNGKEQALSEVELAWAVPRDIIPPGNVSGLTAVSKDKEIELTWSNPGNADFDGVMIVKADQEIPAPAPTPGIWRADPGINEETGAVGDFSHGQSWQLGQTIGIGGVDTQVVYRGAGTSFPDPNLVNGQVYYYRIFTFDKAEGTTPGADLKQMGNNYSLGLPVQAAPGKPPGSVQDFYAVSEPELGQMTLKWTSPVADPSASYGGVLFLYSIYDPNILDEQNIKWSWNLAELIHEHSNVWFNAVGPDKDIKVLAVYNSSADFNTPEELTINNLDTDQPCFIKAFAFNNAGGMNNPPSLPDLQNFRFALSQKAAAVPKSGAAPTVKVYNLSIGLVSEKTVDQPASVSLAWTAEKGEEAITPDEFDVYRMKYDAATNSWLWEEDPLVVNIQSNGEDGLLKFFSTGDAGLEVSSPEDLLGNYFYFTIVPQGKDPNTYPHELLGVYTYNLHADKNNFVAFPFVESESSNGPINDALALSSLLGDNFSMVEKYELGEDVSAYLPGMVPIGLLGFDIRTAAVYRVSVSQDDAITVVGKFQPTQESVQP